MITLVHENINEIMELSADRPYVLIIENTVFFRSFIQQVMDNIDGIENQIVMSQNHELFKQNDSVVMLRDFFDFDYKNKKIVCLLLKQLNSKMLANIYETNEIYQRGYNFIVRYLEEFDTKFILNDEIDIQGFLKLYNPTIDIGSNPAEKLINYINLHIEFFRLQLIIFVDIQNFFNREELEQILLHCKYKEVAVLLLQTDKKYDLTNEKILIIDNDLCEIMI